MAVFLCCLFFVFTIIFGCAPLEDISEQTNETETSTDQEDIPEVIEGTDPGENMPEEAGPQEDTEEVTEEDPGQEDQELQPGELTINVYYSDQMAEYLIPESRIIPSGNKYIEALNELMKKPVDGSLVSLVPDSAKINSIEVIDGNAKVDFTIEFLDDRFVSDTVDILLLYSIVNTLTQFSEINSVTLYIDGEKLDLLGQLDIKDPVFRRNDLIKES